MCGYLTSTVSIYSLCTLVRGIHPPSLMLGRKVYSVDILLKLLSSVTSYTSRIPIAPL